MSEIKVAIVGAGMAGLTAALRLAERGYQVTLYEQKPYTGGQFGAHSHGHGVYHEHCYHMLLNWYNNFWQIVGDLGLSRERDFAPRTAIRHMYKGSARMPALINLGSPRHVWDNLFSGVVPIPDMFLYSYSLIDLLAHPFRKDRLLEEYSVNSFMQSRPYATEQSAALHEETLAKAFALPSYLTSAASYKNFVKYGLRYPEPMMWILKGDCERHFQRHLRARLQALGCEIKLSCEVTTIRYDPVQNRVTGIAHAPGHGEECFIGLERPERDAPPPSPSAVSGDDTVDYLVLAVRPTVLGKLIAPRSLKIFPAAADLPPRARAQLSFPPLSKLQNEPMGSLDLFFKKKLPGIPEDHVVLVGSTSGLTFIDNSQAWPGLDKTVLNVIASDLNALANLDGPGVVDAMVTELSEYLRFDRGDLDAALTHFEPNVADELFVNEVGSEHWRPVAKTAIPNLFLAGDFCQTPVDVVTVEGAVVSGLLAAQALQAQAVADRRLRGDDRHARPITVIQPDAYPEIQMMALKLLLAPYAYAAKGWSWANEQLSSPGAYTTPEDLFALGLNLLGTPYSVAAEWWKTAWSMYADLRRDGAGRR